MKMQKQAGFGLVSISIALIFIMTMGFWYAKAEQQRRLMSEVEPFVKQVAFIKEAINAHQLDKLNAGERLNSPRIFPAKWSDLEGDYVTACAKRDHQKGHCKPIYQTPWGKNMVLGVKSLRSPYYAAKITIPLPRKAPLTEKQRQAHMAELGKFAEATFDDRRNTITLLVHKLSDEVKHELLLSRTGDKTLLGDWDVGGEFAITNARDVTVRNSDGGQRSLATGVVKSFTAKHGDNVVFHKCPQGLIPDIQVSIKGIFNESDPTLFSKVSSTRSYVTTQTRQWVVGLDYFAEVEGESVVLHEGEVNVQQICINS